MLLLVENEAQTKPKMARSDCINNPLILSSSFSIFQQRFADNFEAEQVGILEMAYMTDERLQSLGIPLGPRLRIMEEVKKLSWHRP